MRRVTVQLALGVACWLPAVAHAMDRVTVGAETGIETSRLAAQLLVELPQGLPAAASVYVDKVAQYTFRVLIARGATRESYEVNLSDVALADRERVLAVRIAEALRVTAEPLALLPPAIPATTQREPSSGPPAHTEIREAPRQTPATLPKQAPLSPWTIGAGVWVPLARPLALATIDANYRFALGSGLGIPLGLRGYVGQSQDTLGTARVWGINAELGLSLRIVHHAPIVSDLRALVSVGFVKADGLANGAAQGESATGYSSAVLLRYDAYYRFGPRALDRHALGLGATVGGILRGLVLFADDREILRMLGPFAGLQLSYVM